MRLRQSHLCSMLLNFSSEVKRRTFFFSATSFLQRHEYALRFRDWWILKPKVGPFRFHFTLHHTFHSVSLIVIHLYIPHLYQMNLTFHHNKYEIYESILSKNIYCTTTAATMNSTTIVVPPSPCTACCCNV